VSKLFTQSDFENLNVYFMNIAKIPVYRNIPLSVQKISHQDT